MSLVTETDEIDRLRRQSTATDIDVNRTDAGRLETVTLEYDTTPDLPDEGETVRLNPASCTGSCTGTVTSLVETAHGGAMHLRVEMSSAAKFQEGRTYSVGADADWELVE